MRSMWELSRRRFLALLSLLGLLRASPGSAAPPPPRPANGYRVLTEHQVKVLEAIAEQIIPTDQDPGARDAGAVNYIDRVLSGEQQKRLPLYIAGIQGIDETSRALFGQAFLELAFDQQTEVLKVLEAGTATGENWTKVSSAKFFSTVWNHVLEGFYGPPDHGGNKDYVSWKMVGYPEHSDKLWH